MQNKGMQEMEDLKENFDIHKIIICEYQIGMAKTRARTNRNRTGRDQTPAGKDRTGMRATQRRNHKVEWNNR